MIKRHFVPGTEWLYYRIYTGFKTSDKVLTEIILPLTDKLMEGRKIDKWFFIRYADPHHHLRLRLHLTDLAYISQITQEMADTLTPLVDDDLVWKIELGTYHRELERYYPEFMELAETLFHIDSQACSSFISMIEGEEGERLRWLYGIRAIDVFLDASEDDLNIKFNLIENMKLSFQQEFNMTKLVRRQLNDKYRIHRQDIATFIEADSRSNPDNDFNPIYQLTEDSKSKYKFVFDEIKMKVQNEDFNFNHHSFLGSCIHMLMN